MATRLRAAMKPFSRVRDGRVGPHRRRHFSRRSRGTPRRNRADPKEADTEHTRLHVRGGVAQGRHLLGPAPTPSSTADEIPPPCSRGCSSTMPSRPRGVGLPETTAGLCGGTRNTAFVRSPARRRARAGGQRERSGRGGRAALPPDGRHSHVHEPRRTFWRRCWPSWESSRGAAAVPAGRATPFVSALCVWALMWLLALSMAAHQDQFHQLRSVPHHVRDRVWTTRSTSWRATCATATGDVAGAIRGRAARSACVR